jgi:HD superfamily phosphohydrolase
MKLQDLGHGPFSHAFESWVHKRRFVNKSKLMEIHQDHPYFICNLYLFMNFHHLIDHFRPQSNWHHETMSQNMLEYLIDDNHLDFEREDINYIKDLIKPSRYKYYQILHLQ